MSATYFHFLLGILFLLQKASSHNHNHGRLLLCYVTSWSQHRPPPYDFRLEDTPPEVCTHLVYAFAGVDEDTSELVAMDTSDIDNFQQFKSIKVQNPHLKTILAVGGWEHGSRPFSMMTSSFETRQVFINQSVAFLTKHGMDGLEIFWEYPSYYERGGLWEDKQNFADLLTEMGPVYRGAGLILSAAVPSARWIIDAGYNPDVMQRELDFVSIMTYDLHGSWESTVGHHSPLRSSDNLNMKSVAEYWVSIGMKKEKLVIGLPLYGRTFQLASPYLTAPGSGAVGQGSPGKYTDEPGFLAYYEVCELLSSEQADFRRHWLQQADVPYMEDGQDWVGYDDADSIVAKVAWLIGEGYAGAMVWTLDMDDFRGACPLSRAPYPMINRIHRLLRGENGTVGQTCRENGVMGYPCDDVSATCSAETNVCVCSSPTVSDGLQCLQRKYPGEPCNIQTDVCVNESSCDFISGECKCRYEFYLDGNNCIPKSRLEEECDTKIPTPCLGEQTRCSLGGTCVCVTGFKPLHGQCVPQSPSAEAPLLDVGSSTDASPHDVGSSTDALPPKVGSSTDAPPPDVELSTDAPPANVGFIDLQISVDTGATTASKETEKWDRPGDTDSNGDVGASNDADVNADTLNGTANLATANDNTLNSLNVLMIDKHMLQKIRDAKGSDIKTDILSINHLTEPKEFHNELEDTVQEIKPGVPEAKHFDVVDTTSDDDNDYDKEEEEDSLKGPVAVCYYSSWSSDRHGKARFLPEDIDPILCTHLVYAFANIDDNFQLTMANSFADEKMYASFNGLKARNPEVKTLLAVGGWEFGSWVFSQLASSEENRKNFTTSCVDLLPTWGFDGLDVDWEYPVLRGGDQADKENFVTLLQELRTTFIDEAKRSGNPRLLLSVAVAAGKETVDTAYDVKGIAKHVDFMSIMTYDLHGSWDPVTGYNAPLFPRSEDGFMDRTLTMQWAANYWVDQGAPKSKLVVGLAAYGRTFTLLDPNNWSIGSSVIGAGAPGEYTREAGFLTYFEIGELVDSINSSRCWDDEAKVPYLVTGNQWVSYDDEESIAYKVNWIREEGFLGAMVWSLDQDDFRQFWRTSVRPFSLTAMILSGLREPLELPVIIHEPCIPPNVTTGDTTARYTMTFCESRTDGLYANPWDCQTYYHCSFRRTFLKYCPPQLRFYRTLLYCDWPENVKECYDDKDKTEDDADDQVDEAEDSEASVTDSAIVVGNDTLEKRSNRDNSVDRIKDKELLMEQEHFESDTSSEVENIFTSSKTDKQSLENYMKLDMSEINIEGLKTLDKLLAEQSNDSKGKPSSPIPSSVVEPAVNIQAAFPDAIETKVSFTLDPDETFEVVNTSSDSKSNEDEWGSDLEFSSDVIENNGVDKTGLPTNDVDSEVNTSSDKREISPAGEEEIVERDMHVNPAIDKDEISPVEEEEKEILFKPPQDQGQSSPDKEDEDMEINNLTLLQILRKKGPRAFE